MKDNQHIGEYWTRSQSIYLKQGFLANGKTVLTLGNFFGLNPHINSYPKWTKSVRVQIVNGEVLGDNQPIEKENYTKLIDSLI
jgi:hypothetical protein